MNKLLTCTFNNGIKSCEAIVYNLYPVLVYLDLLQISHMPRTHTLCWIRDYKNGDSIETYDDLIAKISSECEDLRISFFAENITSLGQLSKAAKQATLPLVSQDKVPQGLTVYTLWWHCGKMQITRSNVNDNRGAVHDLFRRVQTAYSHFYAFEEL